MMEIYLVIVVCNCLNTGILATHYTFCYNHRSFYTEEYKEHRDIICQKKVHLNENIQICIIVVHMGHFVKSLIILSGHKAIKIWECQYQSTPLIIFLTLCKSSLFSYIMTHFYNLVYSCWWISHRVRKVKIKMYGKFHLYHYAKKVITLDLCPCKDLLVMYKTYILRQDYCCFNYI